MTSLPKGLFERTLALVEGVEPLKLAHSVPLTSAMSPEPVGLLEVRTGERIAKVVTISLVVPPIGMDSHMIFAFTPGGSAIPHFTLDSVQAGGTLAFHLDLVPRAELASHLAYLNAVFQPLSETFERSREAFGSLRAAIGPRHYAMI